MSSLRVIVLGSGTSHGIPMIGCDCAVCQSPDPRDRRTRTSIIIEVNDHPILVDTGPELRLQCLACSVNRAEAVLFTHHHADHVVGLDDLRRFNVLQGTALTCYADRFTGQELQRMFPYAFRDMPDYPSAKPHLNLAPIDGPFDLFGTRITPIPLMHGPLPILGFRVGPFAYCTDCSFIPEQSFALLEDLQVLILDGLRRRPHPTHFNLDQAVAAAERIGARQTFFTHIAHELPHEATNRELPPNMALAHDGQIISICPGQNPGS